MHKHSPDPVAHVKTSNLTGTRADFVAMLLLQLMKYYQEESFLGGRKEPTIFSNPLLTTAATKIFLEEVIQDMKASKIYRDVMYMLTLNIF